MCQCGLAGVSTRELLFSCGSVSRCSMLKNSSATMELDLRQIEFTKTEGSSKKETGKRENADRRFFGITILERLKKRRVSEE
jgi:hypothetical protein